MSHEGGADDILRASFPRVSGDEPGFSLGTAWIQMFSPRERG